MPMPTPPSSPMTRLRVIAISLAAGFLILGLKVLAWLLSGSAALQSDAIESVVNVVAATFALKAIIFAGRPADREHPYGHGKMEYVSAAFEGGLIALAAVFIAWEACVTLHEQWHGIHRLKELGTGLAINLAAGFLNGLLGLFLVRSGRRLQSKALEADGHHVLSDFWTSLGLAAGLVLVLLTGLRWIDPILALGVAALLARTGLRLVREAGEALLDTEDPGLLAHLLEALNRLRPPAVITVHEMRTLRSGRYTHVDIHMVLPAFYPLSQAHDLAEGLGQEVIREAGIEGELHTHIDPCQQAWCRICAVDPCPIRAEPRAETPAITPDQATGAGPI